MQSKNSFWSHFSVEGVAIMLVNAFALGLTCGGLLWKLDSVQKQSEANTKLIKQHATATMEAIGGLRDAWNRAVIIWNEYPPHRHVGKEIEYPATRLDEVKPLPQFKQGDDPQGALHLKLGEPSARNASAKKAIDKP